MLFYLHIPKTGGLTLAYRLATAFTPEQTHVLRNGLHFPKDREVFQSLIKTKQFVETHIAGPLLGESSDCEIMITVRDPVEHILSYWRDILRRDTHPLHRAANKLSYRMFFDQFGDYFMDYQAKYFVQAFVVTTKDIQRLGHYAAVGQRILEFIDRVRWCVPTENIDEFIPLWSIESRRWVPNAAHRLNVSENVSDRQGETLTEAREYLRKRTDLYALDLLFYQMARERFTAYRSKIAGSLGVERYTDNSRRAFISGDSAIWLPENWYDPVPVDGGYAWWAGPQRKSVVHVRRTNGEKYLTFEVIVINGIAYKSIVFFDSKTWKKLPMRFVQQGSHCNICVSLDGLDRECDLTVLVPDCKAAIICTTDSDSLDRQSFAAANWSFRDDPIEQ